MFDADVGIDGWRRLNLEPCKLKAVQSVATGDAKARAAAIVDAGCNTSVSRCRHAVPTYRGRGGENARSTLLIRPRQWGL